MTPTHTHTFAELEVGDAIFDLVAMKLRAAGYDHAIFPSGPQKDDHEVIDMHGIALTRGTQLTVMDEDAAAEIYLQQRDVLGTAIVELAKAAGITPAVIAMDGPQILLLARELMGVIKVR